MYITVLCVCDVTSGEVIAADVSAVELKRFKDVVEEVASGNECGLSLDGVNDYEVQSRNQMIRKHSIAIYPQCVNQYFFIF